MMHRDCMNLLPAAVAVLFATSAAVQDVRTRRIPNRLVVSAAAAALALHGLIAGWHGLAGAATAAVLAFAMMSIGFMVGGVGAGDVKLTGAMGAFAGLSSLTLLLTGTACAGGALALLAIGRRSYQSRAGGGAQLVAAGPSQPLTLPYAVPICCGVLAVFCRMAWSPR